MRRAMIVLLVLAAVSVFAMSAYDTGVKAYQTGDMATAEKTLTEYVEGGGQNSMAYIILGQIEKGKGEHLKAAGFYEKAGENGKGKNRCTGYRCLIYSLNKSWSEKGIPRGDKAVEILEKEYPTDGDARVAIASWANRRGYEFMKAKKWVAATPWLEKAVAARPDFPMFANNLAVVYCMRAEDGGGERAKEFAKKAIDALERWASKPDPKLDATRERAEKIQAR